MCDLRVALPNVTDVCVTAYACTTITTPLASVSACHGRRTQLRVNSKVLLLRGWRLRCLPRSIGCHPISAAAGGQLSGWQPCADAGLSELYAVCAAGGAAKAGAARTPFCRPDWRIVPANARVLLAYPASLATCMRQACSKPLGAPLGSVCAISKWCFDEQLIVVRQSGTAVGSRLVPACACPAAGLLGVHSTAACCTQLVRQTGGLGGAERSKAQLVVLPTAHLLAGTVLCRVSGMFASHSIPTRAPGGHPGGKAG